MINLRNYFNSMAEQWDSVTEHDLHKIRYILNILKIQTGAKIIDVGTGTGILIPFLVELVGKQGEITAVDISDKMLEVAQRKHTYENVSFICCDIIEADLPNSYFDFSICYSVFPHFKDQKSTVKAICNYLKNGGKFVICHTQSREAINNLHKNISGAVAEDILPSLDVINEYFYNLGLETIIEIDNDEMFVIIAKKK